MPRARRALSRAAKDVLDSWPIDDDAKREIVLAARRHGHAPTQRRLRLLIQDRGDLWAIAWLLAPFFLVLPLYANVDSWSPFPFVRSDLMIGLVRSIPGLLAIALGLFLACWWVRIIRPNWLRYTAAEAGHPICLACKHWNAPSAIGERCRECGQPLMISSAPSSSPELPEYLANLVKSWRIDPEVNVRLMRRYSVNRRRGTLREGRLRRRTGKAALLSLDALILVCFGLLLFFGNKHEDLAWIPNWVRSFLEVYGALFAIALLVLFFGGLWFTERFDRHTERHVLAQTAAELGLPVCSRCLNWSDEARSSCARCQSPLVAPLD